MMQAPKLFSSISLLTRFRPTLVVDSLVPYLGIGGVRHKRGRIVHKVTKDDPEGIQYHGFTYYPRTPDEKDPPYEPSKLFSVKLLKRLVFIPYWEKDICFTHLHLENVGDVSIVKNTPSNNKRLYKVKHLVEIKPITFPYGFPEDESSGYLNEHGQYITKKLLTVDVDEAKKQLDALKVKAVDGETLRYRLHQKYYQRWE